MNSTEGAGTGVYNDQRRLNLGGGSRIALEALISNRVRSLLTMFGVSIGVAAVMVLTAFVAGLRTSIQDSVEASGPRNFVLTRFDFTAARLEGDPWWTRPEIRPLEADRIGRLASVGEALYNVPLNVTVDFDGRRLPGVQGQGYAAGWPSYTQGDFVAGRDFTGAEVRRSRAIAVISEELAQELFGGRDPIGQRVGVASSRGGRREFRVVGVFAPAPNIFTAVIRHWVVVPYTAALKHVSADEDRAQILVVPADSVSLGRVKDEVVAMLRVMRGLRPSEPNDFALIESAQVLALIDRLTSMLLLGTLALTSVALMVGGVGVIGIMLISVTERTYEIGLRKAVGATRGEILWQFLAEAGLLTVLGAALGMLVGRGFAELVASFTPLPAAVPAWAVVAALAMAAITGIVFGLLPALRASRLEPVAALRFE